MQDIGLLLAALALYVGIPLLLWAEAWLRAARWFRRVATGSLILWFCAFGLVRLQEWLCEGSSIKGFTTCAVPVFGDVLQRFPLLAGLSLALSVYVAALAVRISIAILGYLRGRTL